MAESAICSVDGCDKPAKTRSFCVKHYGRVRHHGSPHIVLKPILDREVVARALSEIALSETDDCITWPFSKAKNGYGVLFVKGRAVGVHRRICEMLHGPAQLPRSEAAHSCGNGHLACCNPRHLRWATHAENRADKFVHGTNPRGDDNGQSKLTADYVLQIVALRNELSPMALAERFAVSRRAIYDVLAGKTWQHITGYRYEEQARLTRWRRGAPQQ